MLNIAVNYLICNVRLSNNFIPAIWTLFYVLIGIEFRYFHYRFIIFKIIIFSNYGQYIEEHSTGINILKKLKIHIIYNKIIIARCYYLF